jgi:hypothetical protein
MRVGVNVLTPVVASFVPDGTRDFLIHVAQG